MVMISKSIGFVFPVLSTKIGNYFSATDLQVIENWTTVLKYFPFIYISLWGTINRKAFVNRIENYDSILISSVIASLVVFYSIFLYWFSRFRFTLIFPPFLLYDLIERNDRPGNKIINNCVVYGMTLVVTLRNVALIMIKYGMF